jgi:hypothetical protein
VRRGADPCARNYINSQVPPRPAPQTMLCLAGVTGRRCRRPALSPAVPGPTPGPPRHAPSIHAAGWRCWIKSKALTIQLLT